jgi:hypothetical protein
MSPLTIAGATGLKQGNVRRLLGKMVADGEAVKAGYGKYVHLDNVHLLPVKKTRKAKEADESDTAQ